MQSQVRENNVDEPTFPLTLEAKITRGEDISQLRAYICNHTDTLIPFRTGALGAGGSLFDRLPTDLPRGARLSVIGTVPTVLPVLYFTFANIAIAIRPCVISGSTKRARRPACNSCY